MRKRLFPNRIIVRSVFLASLVSVITDAAAADAEYGEYLSSQCTTCHRLTGATDGIPSIVGWPESAFVGAMAGFRSGETDSRVMQTVAKSLSEDEIEALAAYFAQIDPATN